MEYLKNITFLSVETKEGLKYIFLDKIDDTSIEQGNNITDNPIDAVKGTSLIERTIVDMITVGVSGSFSSRISNKYANGENDLFKNLIGDLKLQSIIDWFEKAIKNATIFTIYKKGAVYKNQLLNSFSWEYGKSYSSIDVSLSFIEIELFERENKKNTYREINP